ncbi:MAG: ABC transporter substrate-binding protein [Promethearchaeota archaeon]
MRRLAIIILVVVTAGILLGSVPVQPIRAQIFLKFETDMWYTPSHYGNTEQDVAELLKAQLEATGYFDITLQSAEWGTYGDQLGIMPFFLLGWWFDYPDPSNYIDPFAGGGAYSLGTNYTSSEMQGYIHTMLTNTSATARSDATKAAQMLLAEDCPVIPLFTMLKQFTAYQPDVTGVILEPSENLHYNSCHDGDTEIVIGTTDSIRNIDPADCYEYFGSNTLVQLTHGLMEMSTTSTDAYPGPIIEYFNVSADATEYNFTLKSGIQFSDLTDFNATALKWNIDRAIALNGDPGFLLGDVVNETEVISPTLLRIKLSTPDATFLQRLTYTVAWPISPASLNQTGIEGTPGTAIPRGLGPYNITSWTAGTEMVLETWGGYFGPAPANTKVIIKFYSDASTMLTALETGTIDIAHRVFGPDEITDIQGNPSLNWVMKDTAGIRYFIINCEAIPDVRVRNAISSAVHRSQITSTIFQSFNDPLFSMVPKIFSSHIDTFEDGPNQAHVSGNMTAAGYGYQGPNTVTQSIPSTAPGTTVTVTPGFESLALFTALLALAVVVLVYRKKK